MFYYPEMNEKPEPRLFATRYVWKSYSVTWPESRDTEARGTLAKLRIRALKCAPVQHERLGEWSPLRQFNEDGFRCLISYGAHRKLMDADLCACETLLD